MEGKREEDGVKEERENGKKGEKRVEEEVCQVKLEEKQREKCTQPA